MPQPANAAPRGSYRAHYWVLGLSSALIVGVLMLGSMRPDYERQADEEYMTCKALVKAGTLASDTNCLQMREWAVARLKRLAETGGK